MLGHTIGHAQPDGVMLLGILSFLQFFQADVDHQSKPPIWRRYRATKNAQRALFSNKSYFKNREIG